MSVSLLCPKCVEGNPLAALGIDAPPIVPTHCYGTGDQPGYRGVIGSGTYCPCPCRTWPHQPHELYAVAGREHPDDEVARRDRYIALMVEHGHMIPKADTKNGSLTEVARGEA